MLIEVKGHFLDIRQISRITPVERHQKIYSEKDTYFFAIYFIGSSEPIEITSKNKSKSELEEFRNDIISTWKVVIPITEIGRPIKQKFNI